MRFFERIQLHLVLFLVNHCFRGTHFFAVKRSLLNSLKGVEIGSKTKIVGPLFFFGELKIGANCWIGRNFNVEGNGTLSIKDNCDFGPNVTVYTGGHEIGNQTRRAGKGYSSTVLVESGCWICGSVILLPGVVVHAGSVVGGGSVVNKSVAPDTLVAGAPAAWKRDLPADM